MKKIVRLIVLNVIMVILLNSLSVSASAESKKEKTGSGADFGVSAIYPENQLNGQNGYFDLRMKSSDKQTIEIEVTNYSDHDMTIKVERNRATTGDSGIPEYKNIKKEKDSSLTVDFNDIVEIEDSKINLKEHETKKVPINLSMPVDSFSGQVMGGIHFEQINEKKSDQMIENKFSYSVAILLTEDDKKIENSIAFLEVEPGQRNYRNFIEASIQNKAPVMVKDMSIEAKIYGKDNKKKMYEAINSRLRMAPNSTFKYGIDLKNTKLVAGEYTYVLKIVADKKDYQFSKNFTIDKETAQNLNKQSVNLEEENPIWLWYVIGIVLIIATITIFGAVIWHRKKVNEKKKKDEKRRKRMIRRKKLKRNELKNKNK